MLTERHPVRTAACLLALVAAAMTLAGCGEQVQWNQKLTVAVETPDGLKTGSAVQRVRIYNKAGIFEPITPIEARGVADELRGEAVVVDLGGGRYVFMLVSGASLITQRVLEWSRPWFPNGARTVARFDGVAEVPPDAYPRLVTFTDIDDPASVQLVDPDDLAATFGPGTRLQSITLEITDEPVTQGRVEEVLGDDFFKRRAGIREQARQESGLDHSYFQTLSASLTKGDFLKERSQ